MGPSNCLISGVVGSVGPCDEPRKGFKGLVRVVVGVTLVVWLASTGWNMAFYTNQRPVNPVVRLRRRTHLSVAPSKQNCSQESPSYPFTPLGQATIFESFSGADQKAGFMLHRGTTPHANSSLGKTSKVAGTKKKSK